ACLNWGGTRFSLFAFRFTLFAFRFSLFAFRFSLFAFRFSLFAFRFSRFESFVAIFLPGALMKKDLSRRNFLKQTAGAASALAAAKTLFLPDTRIEAASYRDVAPSDTIRFGMIRIGIP